MSGTVCITPLGTSDFSLIGFGVVRLPFPPPLCPGIVRVWTGFLSFPSVVIAERDPHL